MEARDRRSAVRWIKNIAPSSGARVLLAFGIFLAISATVRGQDAPKSKPASAPEVVATLQTPDYIERFVQYVHWPAEGRDGPWRVCVTTDLASAKVSYAQRSARGRQFQAYQADTPEAVRDCQILDLTGLPLGDAQRFLKVASEAPVLTVGTGATFCSAGGIVCLGSGAEHPFDINLSAVRRSRLLVNARLLSLGHSLSMEDVRP
jgi:hypothetical protein